MSAQQREKWRNKFLAAFSWLLAAQMSVSTGVCQQEPDRLDPSFVQSAAMKLTTRVWKVNAGVFRATADPARTRFGNQLQRRKSGGTMLSSSWVIKNHLFEDFGIKFPEGTSVAYHETSGLLMATHTPEAIDQIKQICSGSICWARLASVDFRIVKIPGETFDELFCSEFENHTMASVSGPTLQRIGELERSGRVAVLGVARSITVSGELCAQLQERELSRIDNPAPRDSRIDQAKNMGGEGFLFECTPTVGADQNTIWLKVRFECQTAARSAQDGEVQPGHSHNPASPATSLVQKQSIETWLTFLSGQTILLGVWDPFTIGENARGAERFKLCAFLNVKAIQR